MGKRNRERRQQKQRRRTRAATGAPHRASAGSRLDPRAVAEMLEAAAHPCDDDRCATAELAIAQLAAWWQGPGPSLVPTVAGQHLERELRWAWSHGWQPTDVVRAVRRRLSARHGRLAGDVIASEARAYRHATGADPRWLAQVGDAWWAEGRPHLDQWAAREALDAPEAVRAAVELLRLLQQMPPLPRLCAPPSGWGQGAAPATPAGLDPKILGRVRALLAKAESTPFPEEAEALSEKAQQLMARHAVDRAVVDAATGRTDEVVGRRLGVDDPYAAAKSMLLTEVAVAGRSRSVWSEGLGFATVFGFPGDLDAVELLYTSLLVQATRAMAAAGSATTGGRRARTRGFRQSFLVAYAHRIGQRLREATDATVADARADHGDALLPVLASRDRAVEDHCDEVFPELTSLQLSINDHRGWAAGVLAADAASLAVGAEVATAAGA